MYTLCKYQHVGCHDRMNCHDSRFTVSASLCAFNPQYNVAVDRWPAALTHLMCKVTASATGGKPGGQHREQNHQEACE